MPNAARPSRSPSAWIVAFAAASSGALVAQTRFAELRRGGWPDDASFSTSVAVADLDGDGDLDVLFGSVGIPSAADRLYRNEGAVGFVDATAVRWPGTVNGAVVRTGDVDGDGDVDAVTFGTGVRVIVNDGRGFFAEESAARIPPDPTVYRGELGDIDGDADPDIVALASSGFVVYRNNGAGVFAVAANAGLTTTSSFNVRVRLADLDGDGDLDVLGVHGQPAPTREPWSRLWINDGSGRFVDETAARLPTTPPAATLEIGDADGDGDLDLVLGVADGALQSDLLLRNDGAGSFLASPPLPIQNRGDVTRALALGDLDGDGDLDLIVGSDAVDRPTTVHRNDGGGTFTPVGSLDGRGGDGVVAEIRIADVDGDRRNDVVLAMGGSDGREQPNLLLVNAGGLRFIDVAPDRFPVNANVSGRGALGDVDGDGDLDLLEGTSDDRFQIGAASNLLVNDGDGWFVDESPFRMPDAGLDAVDVELVDLDADGDLDAVIADAALRSILLFNDGGGRFAVRQPVSLPASRHNDVAVGDLDGDGSMDVVLAVVGSRNQILLNDGAGNLTDVSATRYPPTGGGGMGVALADVDADGDLDLAVAERAHGAARPRDLLLNQGGAWFASAPAGHLDPGSTSRAGVAFADVDGDGDPDLLFFGSAPPLELFRNDGSGRFAAAALPALPGFAEDLCVADFDLDGDVDIVLLSRDDPRQPARLRLLRNDGAGGFAAVPEAFETAADQGWLRLTSGDIDADGDPDLVVFGVRRNRVFLNLLRQLDLPERAHVGGELTLAIHDRTRTPRLGDLVLPYVAAARASIPVPGLGRLGIDPGTAIALPPVAMAPSADLGRLSVTLPNEPALVHVELWAQALFVPYPSDARLTNTARTVILR